MSSFYAPDCSLSNIIGELHMSFINACDLGDLELAKAIYLRRPVVLTFKNNIFVRACTRGRTSIAEWLWTFDISDGYVDISFLEAYRRDFTDTTKLLYKLDNMVLVRWTGFIYRGLLQGLDFDDYTIDAIMNIQNGNNIPDMEIIPDIVVHMLFKFNRVDELKRLSLPYVSYYMVDGLMVGIIKRMKAKSAMNKKLTI